MCDPGQITRCLSFLSSKMVLWPIRSPLVTGAMILYGLGTFFKTISHNLSASRVLFFTIACESGGGNMIYRQESPSQSWDIRLEVSESSPFIHGKASPIGMYLGEKHSPIPQISGCFVQFGEMVLWGSSCQPGARQSHF